MIPRGSIIAALLVVELAIVGTAVYAVRGGQIGPSSAFATAAHAAARPASGPNVPEGGPHRIFAAGAHPAVTIDIGYADLTIRASKGSQVDVSVSPSRAFGPFRETAPITASEDGGTIRIVASSSHRWTIGDDRMVTVLVPPETRITVVEAGDIRASGLRADASFASVGGGFIVVDDFDAPTLHAETSNGRIELHQIATTHLDATSRNGHVEGTALHVHDGNIESEGRVTLGFAAGADTLVSAATNDGKIRVSGFPAAASVATLHKSGSDDDDDSSSLTVRVGAGSGHLAVHASDGNITLTQEG